MIRKMMKWTGVAALVFVALLGVSLLLLQTERSKEKIRKVIIALAAEHNIDLKIGSIEGSLPLKLSVHQVHLRAEEGVELDIDTAKVRIAIFPLLYRELQLSYLSAEHVRVTIPDALPPVPLLDFSEQAGAPLKPLILPFSLSVKGVKIPHLKVLYQKEQIDLAIEADGKIKRRLDLFYGHLRAVPLSSPLSFMDLSLQGNRLTRYIGVKGTSHFTSTRLFSPFFPVSFDAEGLLTAQLEGPWQTWRTLLKRSSITETAPLKGFVKGLFSRLEIPEYPQLNRKWKLASSFSIGADRSLTLGKSQIKSDLLTVTSQGKIDSLGAIQEGSLSFLLPQVSELQLNIPVQGSLKGRLLYQNAVAIAKFSSSNLKIGEDYYASCEATLRAKKEGTVWEGKGEASCAQEELPLRMNTDFLFNQNAWLRLKNLTLTAPDTQLSGNLELQIPHYTLEGELFAQSANLSRFQKWLPDTKLKGQMGAEVHLYTRLEGSAPSQELKIHMQVKDFLYDKFTAQEMILDGELVDLFNSLEGKVQIDAQRARYASLLLSQFQMTTRSENGKWPYAFHAKGMWEDSLDVTSSGIWIQSPEQIDIQVASLTGFMFKKPFALKKPLEITCSQEELVIHDWEMRLADGSFVFNLDLSKTYSKGSLQAEHFPLDLFFLSNPTLSFAGNTSIDASFEATPETIEGHANILLEQANLTQMGKSEPLLAKGYLQAHFNQETLQLQAGIKATQDQHFECTATLPLTYTASPFQLALDENRPLSSEINMDGKLEEIFDFINIGSHQVKGQLIAHLFASRTLSSPLFLGNVELIDGSYENIRTGTYLQNIYGQARAENHEIEITSFKGNDEKGGTLNAQGKLEIKPLDFFPYTITAEMQNLNAVRFDSVTANFSGQCEVSGDARGATASGNLTVSQAELDIPDDIPGEIPVLPISYVNLPEGFTHDVIDPLSLFPFSFDLTLSAPATTPGQVIVRGRGLRSEWQGDIHLSGKNTDVALSGTLNLLRGEFVFSGKVFTLSQGEIILIDKPQQTTHLNLAGTLELSDATITVLLSGPLTAPQLTFQSTPHMATSSILSRILFNKDISEISPIQAIQLAQTIMTMAGSAGPDVLEKIRRGLGVDRLNIVSSPNGSDEISVQIGKYLTRGVMVTLSQSADSSNVIIEVELRKGFIFQAETQEDQQGKFTLKWNRNY